MEAVIEHITQTLPNANGEYCEPLSQHYLKALAAVLDHKANVEHLKVATWLDVVDFCLRGIKQYLDNSDGEPPGLSRNLSGLGSAQVSGSGTKFSTGNSRSQSQAGPVSRQNAEDLLQCLLSLVSAPNAPLSERADDLVTCIILFLRSQGSTASQIHQLAFSILNAVLSFTRADRTTFSQSIAQDVIPVICRFWQGKSVAKDGMMNSVRDEMLVLLLNVHLHLERSIIEDEENNELIMKLEDLVDVLKVEYSKRLDRDRLQLDDLEMMDFSAGSLNLPPFRLNAFRLRSHNNRAERN